MLHSATKSSLKLSDCAIFYREFRLPRFVLGMKMLEKPLLLEHNIREADTIKCRGIGITKYETGLNNFQASAGKFKSLCYK